LVALGNHARHIGQYELGVEYITAGLEMARGINYAKGQALAYLHRSQLLLLLQQTDKAQKDAQDGLTLAHRTGLKSFEAHALTNMAHTWFALGRYGEALTLYREALVLRQKLGERQWALDAEVGLLRTWWALGNRGMARSLAERLVGEVTAVVLLGSETPFHNLVSLIELLQQTDDARAEELLLWGQTLLQQTATRIQDDILRHSFLHHVEVHHRLAGG
jgi:tetratricopeptide (TPR) repeat protein